MKRPVIDVLRRSFNTTLNNWPLLILRIGETILFLAIIVGAAIATIVPFLVSAGLSDFGDMKPDEIAQTIATKLMANWILIVYALVVMLVVFAILIAIHAFVDGSTAQILVDSERINTNPAFDLGRWFRGGVSTWWRIFWLYNAIWSIAGLVMLVPLTATLVAMLLIPSAGGRVVMGCGGLAISVLVMFPAAIVAAIWTQKAVAVVVGRNTTVTEAMRASRVEIMADFGRHAVVAILLMAISIAGSMAISMVGWPLSFMKHDSSAMFGVIAPLQFAISCLQSIFSAAVNTWFLAAYISLTEER